MFTLTFKCILQQTFKVCDQMKVNPVKMFDGANVVGIDVLMISVPSYACIHPYHGLSKYFIDDKYLAAASTLTKEHIFLSIFEFSLNIGTLRCKYISHDSNMIRQVAMFFLSSMISMQRECISLLYSLTMMTSWNENIFRVTGQLCGQFTGHWWIPRTKTSDAELWCFLWSAPE